MPRIKFSTRQPNVLAAMIVAIAFTMAAGHGANAAQVENGEAQVEAAPASGTAPALFTPFTPSAAKSDQAVARGRQVVRFRTVDIDRNLLTKAAGVPRAFGQTAATLPTVGQSVTLNLFDDVTFIAEADRIEQTARGVTWVGHLRGIELSQVVLVINGDVVAGNISMPAKRYHIRYAGNGAHEIQEIDQSKFPVDERYVPVRPKRVAPNTEPAQDPSAQADDGSIIDVMVIYSATTRAAAGGATAMRAEIDLGITETNQSYQNSGIAPRVRLVHAEEAAYAETGKLGDALDCITETSDGCLDYVHALRNLYAADLVSFWVEKGDACGLAWWDSPSVAAADGFSALQRDCATGNYSFGHEMGHNMGAHHDVLVEPVAADNAYAHGYVNVAAGWRTVMAYDKACEDVGKTCTRIQYWSNPALRYGGAALGNSSADNHRILNSSASAIANFRTNAFVPPPPPAGGGNFIVSPGFESGPGGWVQSDADLIWNDSQNAHTGGWAAWLGYYNDVNHVVYQDVAIPANAQQAVLQFWYKITTAETTTTIAYDFGTVDVVNPASGATLASLGTLSNLDITNGWVQSVPRDLTAYKGSTVRLRFRATTDPNKGTSFFFDDVSLNVTLTASTVNVVEFYNTNLDNYFITANASEASAIDSGAAGPGWSRTGNTFKSGGSTPVCRFYGSLSPGPNSHFYTVNPIECANLKAQQIPAGDPRQATVKSWNFESLDFLSTPSANGTCPTGTASVYRAYNNGFIRGVDSNHRIASSQAAIQQAVSRGWINEGVVMCAPQ